jgi:hypothetical protein
VGDLILKTKVSNAYIPDDYRGTRLSSKILIDRLDKMNKQLHAKEWRILKCEKSGEKGHYETFAMKTDTSFEALRVLPNRIQRGKITAQSSQ